MKRKGTGGWLDREFKLCRAWVPPVCLCVRGCGRVVWLEVRVKPRSIDLISLLCSNIHDVCCLKLTRTPFTMHSHRHRAGTNEDRVLSLPVPLLVPRRGSRL